MLVPSILAPPAALQTQGAARVAGVAMGVADGKSQWFRVSPFHIPTGLDGMNEPCYGIVEFLFHTVKGH